MSELVAYILVFLLWLGFSAIEGVREAYYFFSLVNTKNIISKNLHPVFALQRGIIIAAVLLFSPDICNGFLMAVILSLIFPFFHDGMYYYIRNKLDFRTYPKRWRDRSLSSNAIIDLNFKWRVIFFITGMGLMGYFIYHLLKFF